MAVKKNLISQEGYEKILAEIALITDNQLPETLEVLKDARSQGDLSENADYHAAKDKISMLKRRLAELEDMIKDIEIIQDDHKATATTAIVGYGSVVTVSIEGDKEFTVEIVGGGEVNVSDNKLAISLDSPLGKALDGKKKGDNSIIKLATGDRKVSILSVV